jgi:hypothetical protein
MALGLPSPSPARWASFVGPLPGEIMEDAVGDDFTDLIDDGPSYGFQKTDGPRMHLGADWRAPSLTLGRPRRLDVALPF